ncbi:MAG: HAD family hydrolase, partial [Acidimicrobiia bacterium]|nr:HAD family hydrolase [Acidimicrobiia bacterium]
GRLGIAERFEAIIRSVDVGVGKPDPAIIKAALVKLDVGESEVVLVGDSEESDVGAARAAGIRSVLLDRHGTTTNSQADWVIGSLRELPALVAAAD